MVVWSSVFGSKVLLVMTDERQTHPNAGLVLAPGQAAVDFTLPNTDGRFYTLSTALTTGPLILVFYRGDW
jgi:hypothetical protein